MGLQISRRRGESVKIGDDIYITVLRTGNIINLLIDAPKEVPIARAELLKPRDENNED